jgi:hypothetical protein
MSYLKMGVRVLLLYIGIEIYNQFLQIISSKAHHNPLRNTFKKPEVRDFSTFSLGPLSSKI